MPPRVSIALLISFLACTAFFGEFAWKEYTKMFVSRKNLPLIHLVPAEASPRLYMFQALHQSVELLRAAASCCKLFQPFAEHRIERLMLGFGQQARLLDQSLICTEGDVFHTKSVYTIFVSQQARSFRQTWCPLCPRLMQSVGKTSKTVGYEMKSLVTWLPVLRCDPVQGFV